MKLKILLPTKILVNQEVSKVVAEAPNGFFCLLPRHVDFASAIVPGMLSFTTPEGKEMFVAVDEGVLVKQSGQILVSTRNAATGAELGRLDAAVSRQFRQRDEREKKARQAMNRIETGLVRRFLDIHRSN